MGTRGVWSLGNVESKYPLEDWVNYKDPWISQYDIAHSRPYPAPNLQRWNLGTSTMSDSGLACSRYWGQASGSTTFSYFASGDASPGMTKKSNTDKLTYSPYTIAATPTANLNKGIDRGGASSSNLAAYFSTGYPTGSWVDKILFATDTRSTISGQFDANYMTFSSVSDGAGGGYLFEANVSQSKTYKITYSTDGVSHLPGSNLVNYTTEGNGEMMSRTAGYKTGGANPSPAATTTTNKLTYSSTTWSALPAGGLPRAKRRAASGTGRSKGFVGGGDLNVAPVYSDFALLDFSTDTFAQEPALNFSPSSYAYYPNKSTTTPLDGLYGADKATDMNSFWSGDEKRRWYDNGPNAVEFDGTDDALYVADFPNFRTNNFTVECWIYAHSTSGGINTILDTYPDSGSFTGGWWALHQYDTGFYWGRNNANAITTSGNLSVNTWYHVAMVRNGTSNKLYLNGTSIGNFTETAFDYADSDGVETRTLNVGKQNNSGQDRYFDGLITNVRITIGQALYTANFTPTTESLTTTSQGATASNVKLICCSGATPTSSIVTSGLISTIGDPTVNFQTEVGANTETIVPTASTFLMGPAGETGYAIDFNGSSDALNIPHDDAWSPGTNYTAECWFNCDANGGGWDGIFGQWNNSNVHASNSWVLEYVGSDLRLYYIVDGSGEISYKSLGAVSTGAWHHFAFSKAGSTTRLFVDGVQVVADFDIGTLQDGTGEFTIGGDVASAGWFNGKISNVRITEGQALYTAPFTVTTEPLTTTSQGATASNVKLLCCNQSTATGSTVTPNTITALSTPTASQSAPLTEPRAVVRSENYLGKGRQTGQPSGVNGRSDLTKFNYQTETFSSTVSGTMPIEKKFPGTTSNTTRGYWASGTPGTSSIVDKFVWSTNTGSTIPATLGSARSYASSAAGNQTQGYFTFGSPGSYQNACDKLVYSNETMSNLPSMPFKSARAVAISMQTAGYYGSGAGQDDKGSYFTKITFATDTKSGNIPGWRAHSSGSNMFRSGSSSNTKAYVCSGESTTRAMEATPWATDSVSQLPTTFMPADATQSKGQGDNTNAYFTGGPSYSHTQRVVYSSDTVSVLPGANFPGGTINSYGAGGPGMNGIAISVPNVI